MEIASVISSNPLSSESPDSREAGNGPPAKRNSKSETAFHDMRISQWHTVKKLLPPAVHALLYLRRHEERLGVAPFEGRVNSQRAIIDWTGAPQPRTTEDHIGR